MKFGKQIIVLSFLIAAAVPLHAGIVFLRDGNIVEGNIVSSDTQKVVIDTAVGRVVIRMSLVKEMVGDAEDFEAMNQERISNVTTLMRSTHWWKDESLEQLRSYSQAIPRSYRTMLFEENRKRNAILYSAMNVVPSLGSWIQGDYRGAIATLSFVGIGAGLIVIGSSSTTMNDTVSIALITTGVVVAGITYINNFGRPFRYTRVWNDEVKKVFEMTLLPVNQNAYYATSGTLIHVDLISVSF